MPGLLQGEPVQRADNFAPTKLRPLREITRLRGPAKPSDQGRAQIAGSVLIAKLGHHQIALQVGSMGLNVVTEYEFPRQFHESWRPRPARHSGHYPRSLWRQETAGARSRSWSGDQRIPKGQG